MGEERLVWRTRYSTEAAKAKTSGGASWHARFWVGNLEGGGTGNFTLLVQPHWAPVGARRFRRLVEEHFFDDARFFRVVPGFAAQFGIPGDPDRAAQWQFRTISDDVVRVSNKRGRVSFAASGPDTRTTQVFINLGDNRPLDMEGAMGGFAPFAEVVEGMEVVDALYRGYGDGPPVGAGPSQQRILRSGNAYLNRDFPRLSFVATVGFDGGDAVGLAAREEDLSGVLGRLWLPLAVAGPLLLCALVAMARVFGEVRRRCAEEEPPRRARAPAPQTLGHQPLE